MTPRAHLTQILEDALDDVTIEPYARDGIQPDKPLVMLRLNSVTPGPVQGVRSYAFSLILVTPLVDEHGAADDELDQLLEDVLHTLTTADQLTGFDTATRATYSEAALPAYDVTLTVHFTITEE
jgi:hypothetical protein